MDRKSVTAAPEAAKDPDYGQAGQQPSEAAARDEAHHVDARELEDALLTLRERIAGAPLFLNTPGADQARAVQSKLLAQIDDYLMPRLHNPARPILVAVVGSTGAGKSTLVNSIVGQRVSATGIRRPTTNSPVLACHPNDAEWFAENRFLPTLPRVRQEGLARPGRDGLLVIAGCAGMPRGLALLDTPDIDSVVRAHYDFAHQFLDASDLWLFITTAARYADAPVWALLQHAKERGAALGIVLSRVPEAGHSDLVSHFCAMLEANDIDQADRFVIPETIVSNGMLPREVFAPVHSWLEEAAVSEDRRVAVLTQTMSGVLDTFRDRVPELAAQVETQLAVRADLQGMVRGAYDSALADLEQATTDGSLLRGEVLARWQDFAGTGELLRTLQIRHPRGPGRQPRKRRNSVRLRALEAALRSSLESMIVALGDRAAEDAVATWAEHPTGAALLASFEGAGRSSHGGHDGHRDGAAVLGEASSTLARRAARAVSGWQDHVLHLVRAEGAKKRSVARVVSFDDEALAAVLMIDVLGYGAGAAEAADTMGAADAGAETAAQTAAAQTATSGAAAAEAAGPQAAGVRAADVWAAAAKAVGARTADAQAVGVWAAAETPGAETAGAGTAGAGTAADGTAGGQTAGAGTAGVPPAGAAGPGAADAELGPTIPQRLLGSLLGSAALRALSAKVTADLRSRLSLLFEEEMLRFAQVVDAVPGADAETVAQLHQATYALESAR